MTIGNVSDHLVDCRAELLDSHISSLGLDTRTINVLESDLYPPVVRTVRELLMCTRDSLLSIPNVGGRTIERILDKLGEHGFKRLDGDGNPVRTEEELRLETRARVRKQIMGI